MNKKSYNHELQKCNSEGALTNEFYIINFK